MTSTIPPLYSPYASVYGPAIYSPVLTSRVLVVGAGGIGCELLKNLVLAGFPAIDIIDLDTIDISNLNRQFLFRRHHVGQPKALVAREAAMEMARGRDIEIKAYHANIKEKQFDNAYFQRFHLVLNALDNLDARRHVNRMCLANNIPLIESGTQGYLGQTSVIKPHTTECFECNPVAAQKTYPVCTIRNTPDKPVHTIVWAKFIYNALFGPKDADNPMNDYTQAIEGLDEKTAGTTLFDLLFHSDILKQRAVADRWINRPPPTPIDYTQMEDKAYEFTMADDSRVLSMEQNACWLLSTISRIYREKRDFIGSLSFDKDDELAMNFVAAAANLRMFIYAIPMESRFTIKGIAGNIIHAIATTNAVAAGLIVHSAILILGQQMAHCQNIFISRVNPLLSGEPLAKPNPACYICSAAHSVHVSLDVNRFTLRQLFDQILIGKLSFHDPILDVISSDNYIGTRQDIEEEQDDPNYIHRTLAADGVLINDGAQINVEDQLQNLTMKITVHHVENLDEEKFPEGYQISGGDSSAPSTSDPSSDVDGAANAASPSADNATASVSGHSNDGGSKKRTAMEEDEEQEKVDKRQRS